MIEKLKKFVKTQKSIMLKNKFLAYDKKGYNRGIKEKNLEIKEIKKYYEHRLEMKTQEHNADNETNAREKRRLLDEIDSFHSDKRKMDHNIKVVNRVTEGVNEAMEITRDSIVVAFKDVSVYRDQLKHIKELDV